MAQKKSHEVDNYLIQPPHSGTITLLYGPDRGLVSERANKYVKATNLDLNDPFSVLRIDADEIDKDPAKLDDEARTISMFGGKRLLWIRNAASQKNFTEAVKRLIADPSPDVFILIEAGDLKKSSGLRVAVETAKSAMALPCYNDDARGIDGLIDDVLRSNNLQIAQDARQLLRLSLGSDRLASRGELEKLCLYAYGQQRIEIEDVVQSIGDVATLSQDEVIDAALTGDLSRFNMAFTRIINAGTHPYLLINTAMRQFSQLQSLRYAMDIENKSAAMVVNNARPPIFFTRKKIVEASLNYWNSEALQRVIERLQRLVLESRQNTELATAIIRQGLLAIVVEAIKLKQRR